jgi:hypothetical protein
MAGIIIQNYVRQFYQLKIFMNMYQPATHLYISLVCILNQAWYTKYKKIIIRPSIFVLYAFYGKYGKETFAIRFKALRTKSVLFIGTDDNIF